MVSDVKVDIGKVAVISNKGSWYPLIYVPVEGESVTPSYSEFSSLENVATGGYADGTEAYAVAEIIFMQENAPEKIAILSGGKDPETVLPAYLHKNWRQLIVLADFDKDVATYIEGSKSRMYFTHVTPNESQGIDSDLSTVYNAIKSFERTMVVYYDNAKILEKTSSEPVIKYPEAYIVGDTAGRVAGSFTYKFAKLKGIKGLDYNDDDIDKIHAKGAITILQKHDKVMPSEGTVASGDFADEIDSKDFISQRIAYNTQEVLNNNDKIAYTDAGISMLEAATLEALVEAYNNGIIADNEDGTPSYEVSFGKRSDTTQSDRASRQYVNGKFSYVLAGAIHKVRINGSVSV